MYTCTSSMFQHNTSFFVCLFMYHLAIDLYFLGLIIGNRIAKCFSYFSCCWDKISWQKATKGRQGLFWLTIQGYNPSWWGSYRSLAHYSHTRATVQSQKVINDECLCLFSCSLDIAHNPSLREIVLVTEGLSCRRS